MFDYTYFILHLFRIFDWFLRSSVATVTLALKSKSQQANKMLRLKQLPGSIYSGTI